jgi:hypothetical protein
MLAAQILVQGSGAGNRVRLVNSDLAVLELGEPRRDLPCTVSPIKPFLGFNLRFHSGYDVAVPLNELAGAGNTLTLLFRVTSDDRKDKRSYFLQKVKVPAVEEGAKGDTFLQGGFDLGEGAYHVDWLMRDRRGRICSYYWDIEASLGDDDKQIQLASPHGSVQAVEFERFQEEPPVARVQDVAPLHVKILANFAPQDSVASSLQPLETGALVSILRRISRDPRIGEFSLVAFNLQKQKIFFRQDDVSRIDFPGLGEALNSLDLGTVAFNNLLEEHGDTHFLENLVQREVVAKDHPDAVIFVGPKAMLDENVPKETLKAIGRLDYPIFYLNCNLDPRRTPWRDAIGSVVKFFQGFEYLVSRPRDVWFSVKEMVSRTDDFRQQRTQNAYAPK